MWHVREHSIYSDILYESRWRIVTSTINGVVMGSVLVIALQMKILNDHNYKIREKNNNIFEPHSSRKVIKKKPQLKKNEYYILKLLRNGI